jgi:hypothetical protein
MPGEARRRRRDDGREAAVRTFLIARVRGSTVSTQGCAATRRSSSFAFAGPSDDRHRAVDDDECRQNPQLDGCE